MIARETRAYEIRHVVGFEESNLFGNVYFVNHLRWQGRCRELFLKDYVPEISLELAAGLSLVTTRCSCEYLAELAPFDEVIVKMRLADLTQNRITLAFEYWRTDGGREELVARGEQQVVFMRREGGRLTPARMPPGLRDALQSFSFMG
jgi:enediyne biosynthesis thioesterase